VKVTLTQSFANQNNVASYYGVEVQFHAFFTTAIGEDVPITSTSLSHLLTEPHGRTEYKAGREEQKGRIGQEKVLFYKYGNRNMFYQRVG
jgi:hypothetical protein